MRTIATGLNDFTEPDTSYSVNEPCDATEYQGPKLRQERFGNNRYKPSKQHKKRRALLAARSKRINRKR